LNDTDIEKSSKKFSKIYQKMDGVKMAVDVIENSIEFGNDHLITGYYYQRYCCFFNLKMV
jgi:hypothetical protein